MYYRLAVADPFDEVPLDRRQRLSAAQHRCLPGRQHHAHSAGADYYVTFR